MRWDLLVSVLMAAEADDASEELDWFGQLDALADGDRAALARLRRLVTAQLSRSGAYRQRDAWDDFAQDVLVRVWRAHRDGRIRDARSVPAFVRSTTRNAYIDWLRAHRREVDLPPEDFDRHLEGARAGTQLTEELRLTLQAAVESLPERHREVIQAIYLEDLSYADVAAKLERPRGTINRQQREAMAALRARFFSDSPRGKNQ